MLRIFTPIAAVALLLTAASCDESTVPTDGAPDTDSGDVDAGDRDSGPPVACTGSAECDDGLFCNGTEVCASAVCAPGTSPCMAREVCNEASDRCTPIGTGGGGLPIGIPMPTFGYEYDTSGACTFYVDNTNASCDDGRGTEAAPLCDLFQGGRSATYSAGDIVCVLGGPYVVEGDYTLTMNGTEASPVIILGVGATRILFDGEGDRANFDWAGSYAILENLDFFHMTRHVIEGDHLVFRNVAVHNPAGAFIDFNPVVSVRGNNVLIYESEIFNNRRASDTDSHGIQASAGSFNIWILDNELYNNNGDSFQGCHLCFAEPPNHVYIGRNILHEDRENAIDLKTIHDVVISENVMYGYGSSGTSNGDAIVIGSNGYDESTGQGPRRVWVLNNEIRDSSTGIRVEGSQDVWIIGNQITSVNRGLQIDNKPHRDIMVLANTISGVTDGVGIFGCMPRGLSLQNNIILEASDRHLDLGDCGPPAITLTNNLFWNAGGAIRARIDGTAYTDAASLNAAAFVTGTVVADPAFDSGGFVPSAGSPAVDSGADASATYTAYETAFGPSIDRDRAGTMRPVGGTEDIGAYERP